MDQTQTESIPRGSSRTVRVWKSFSAHGPFQLTQVLYGSQQQQKDHLRVDDTKNSESAEGNGTLSFLTVCRVEIEPIGRITIDLLDHGIDPTQFRRTSSPTTGRDYLSMEFEVQVTFGNELEFHIVIPPTGQFPGERLP